MLKDIAIKGGIASDGHICRITCDWKGVLDVVATSAV